MELNHDLGLPSIILKCDSLQVVNAVKATGQNLNRYEQIVDDIKVVLQGLRRWQICHTKRENNYATHKLAKATIVHFIDRV